MSSSTSRVECVPLRRFLVEEDRRRAAGPHGATPAARRDLLLHTAVAYGLAEALRRARALALDSSLAHGLGDVLVRYVRDEARARTDLRGVELLAPRLAVNILEPLPFLRDDDGLGEPWGRYLEVEVPTQPDDAEDVAAAVSQSEEDKRCRSLGAMLYELFSHLSTQSHDACLGGHALETLPEPVQKKLRTLNPHYSHTAVEGDCFRSLQSTLSAGNTRHVTLMGLGLPSSISLVVQNLMECEMDSRPDNAYESLDAVCKDLHLLLLDPPRFLFDREMTSQGSIRLAFREHTLYGREKEVSLITDAFCRVSAGKCEAFVSYCFRF